LSRRSDDDNPERTNTLQIKLVVDEHEVQLGWDAIENLIRDLPDDESLAGVFHTLAGCTVAAVREAIARKSAISDKTLVLLASDGCPEVIEAIAESQTRRLSEPALMQVIQRNWSRLNRSIAGSVENFDQADVMVLSKLLIASVDPSVRCALAANFGAPKLIIKQLLNDPDTEVRRLAGNNLKYRN
jgi:hypothetical protein